jgi:hypothetical protein
LTIPPFKHFRSCSPAASFFIAPVISLYFQLHEGMISATEIKFEFNGNVISGILKGDENDWRFVSQDSYIRSLYGSDTVCSAHLRKLCPFTERRKRSLVKKIRGIVLTLSPGSH